MKNRVQVWWHCLWRLGGRHRWMTAHWKVRGREYRKDYCSCGFNA